MKQQHCFPQAPWTTENISLPVTWPHAGTIVFQGYGLQYRRGLDWALKDISLSIQEREKVCSKQSSNCSFELNICSFELNLFSVIPV